MIAQIDGNYIKTRPYKIYSRMVSYLFFEGRPITTKGQWINPLVFKLFKLQKRMPQLKKVERPIYIIGTGRSGTTILGNVLSMHKQVGFLNEPKAIWHSVYSFEDLIGSYSRGKAAYFLEKADVTPKIKKGLYRIYGAYLRLSGTKRIVDKYPELVFRLPFIFEIFPDAQCLFLVRNGWDTITSIDKWSSRLGEQKNGEIHDWWGVNNRKWKLLKEQVLKRDFYFKGVWPYLDQLQSSVDFAALEWIATMRIGLQGMEEYPNQLLRINYEELVANPENELRNILDFTGLKEDNIFLEYGKKILNPVNRKPEIEIHPSIIPLFEETMFRLNYR